MKISNNITILINEYWLRNITRYDQYYKLSLVFFLQISNSKFIVNNNTYQIRNIFCLEISGGGLRPSLNLSWGGECPPGPLYPPLLKGIVMNQNISYFFPINLLVWVSAMQLAM